MLNGPANFSGLRKYGVTPTDTIFLVFLGLVVIAVCWVGQIAYHEGGKTEVSKENGEAWLAWFAKARKERFDAGYEPAPCSGRSEASMAGVSGAVTEPTTQTWGRCFEALTRDAGALAHLRNPFFESPMIYAAKCEPGNLKLKGALVFEKKTPTPPGSAVGSVVSPLVDADPVGGPFQVRITVCDKSAYPIVIGETEL
jgi:hypothetical protein